MAKIVPSGIPCALGVRPKTGLAVLVVLATDEQPHIVLRERAVLADDQDMARRFLFHHAAELPLSQAAEHIEGLRMAHGAAAEAALERVASACAALGLRVEGVGLSARAPKPAPQLAEIMRSHALIHTAEGDFYSGVWSVAASRQGLRSMRLSGPEAMEVLARELTSDEGDIASVVKDMGRPLGPPWTQDEQAAALAAWAALVSRVGASF